MNRFPPGSIRAAVAAVGDAWILLHEPNHHGERNESLGAEARDMEVIRCCVYLFAYQPRRSMLRRATFGMSDREALELMT